MKYILIVYLAMLLVELENVTTYKFDISGGQAYNGIIMPAKFKYQWMKITRKEILRNFTWEVSFCKTIDNSTHFIINQFSAKTLAHICNIH